MFILSGSVFTEKLNKMFNYSQKSSRKGVLLCVLLLVGESRSRCLTPGDNRDQLTLWRWSWIKLELFWPWKEGCTQQPMVYVTNEIRWFLTSYCSIVLNIKLTGEFKPPDWFLDAMSQLCFRSLYLVLTLHYITPCNARLTVYATSKKERHFERLTWSLLTCLLFYVVSWFMLIVSWVILLH